MFLPPKDFVRSQAELERSYTISEAEAYTRWLATHHYENFHVVSFLLPKKLHRDFYNVYGFCRWADDLGDEMGDPAESLRLLQWWSGELDRMYRGQTSHPVFVALEGTVARHGIPKQPFADLIRAFVQDQTVTRYENWDQLLDYCVYSANPVGRLVLYLCGYSDEERQRLSDATCTALQLANFWQDVTVDLRKDRIYMPLDILRRHDYSVDDLLALRMKPGFRAAMREMAERARELFYQGLPLARMVNGRLSVDLELFSRGGLRVLEKIEKQDYDVLSRRPAISKFERAGLLMSALARQCGAGTVAKSATEKSYAFCRGVARARAKNFYYSFVLLSPDRKNAMCAIYAFMRYCDDLSDEPGAAADAIDRWRLALTNALEGRFDGHPVWPAFHDSVNRFAIPHRYFFEMIEGVRSDLNPRRIATFDELYRYCYQVASVVGLTIIHIFGFDSPQALPLAEKCGIAFQLTNILRDIREDAGRGRVYLPSEDLARFQVSPESLGEGARTENFTKLMEFEAERARAYYDESKPLLDLIHPGSRASLWALIEIYSRLLERIRESEYDVLARRIAVPAWEKGAIALRALAGQSSRGPASSATRARTARP